MPVIDIDDVTKRYGDVQALDGLSLSVEQGTTLGVFGTNGAGKTTLFKLLVGLNRPDSGTVRVDGLDPAEGTTVRERVRYLPEHAGFPPNLTGREVLTFHARMRGVSRARRPHHVERILHTVGLADAADRRVGGYSNGMNRRLGLGTALIGDPQVLILDEPTAGLDPEGIRAFHAVIESLAAETDVTIVFSSHALAEIERLCEAAVVVADGRVAMHGAVEDLRQAAADHVTVRAVHETVADAETAAASLRGVTSVRAVERTGATVEATCDPAAAYGVLQWLQEGGPLDQFEVREPGLEAAYHAAVGSKADDSAAEARADPAVRPAGGETA